MSNLNNNQKTYIKDTIESQETFQVGFLMYTIPELSSKILTNETTFAN